MGKKKKEGVGEAPGKANSAATPKPGWRAGFDFIVMLAGAVLVALAIKAFVFDVYLIPSGSMETALHGRPDGGDRILCSKLNYYFNPPSRWEVAVFTFPYETARRTDPSDSVESYRDQNFVKRVVGLPGETLAIGRGDIWTRPTGSADEFKREVKPDSVQRGMWLNVYAQDFSDISLEELGRFWRVDGDIEIQNETLNMAAGGKAASLNYRAMAPDAPRRRSMVEMPGIPDRYTLRQPVQFRCNHTLPGGEVCDHVFVKTIHTQNMEARCPACGTLLDETAAIFYHRRSGLPEKDARGINYEHVFQGETAGRRADYHIVSDLRVMTDMTLRDRESCFNITLREDNRFVQAVFSGDGRVELRVNGEDSRVEHRALADIRPGTGQKIEFYMVDGTARVFVDSSETPLLDEPIWNDRRPLPKNLAKTSGVGLAATNGAVQLDNITIDRDIFYYSSWEYDTKREYFPAMKSPQGDIRIDVESFLPMGDHAPSSYDARSWGPVPLSLLKGPALFVWWPPERIGKIAAP